MIDTLVISIGGIKGISFVGALEEIFKKIDIKDIKYIIGSSVGSILSFLISIGYRVDEIYSICTEIDFNKFTLDSCDKLHECIDNDICSIDNLNNFGFDNCNGIIHLLKSITKIKCDVDITFKEHFEKYEKELTIVVTDIDNLKASYFNYKNNPDDKIIDAIKLSISIPIIYIMQNYKNCNYTDGGISNLYPINYYNKETSIGICLFKNIVNKKENNNIINYLTNIIYTLEIYIYSLIYQLYEEYTIFIDSEHIDTTFASFDISSENKHKLYSLGKSEFHKYYKKYEKRFQK